MIRMVGLTMALLAMSAMVLARPGSTTAPPETLTTALGLEPKTVLPERLVTVPGPKMALGLMTALELVLPETSVMALRVMAFLEVANRLRSR